MVDFPKDPESFKLVEDLWNFDREFYERFGADFSVLEDPSPEGLIYRLRKNAAICVLANSSTTASEQQVNQARLNLRSARDRVYEVGKTILRPALERADEITSYDHPALASYAERDIRGFRRTFGDKYHPGQLLDESGMRYELRMRILMVQVGLVRPCDPKIFPEDSRLVSEGSKAVFTEIMPHGCGGSAQAYPAFETADQLVYARASIGFGL